MYMRKACFVMGEERRLEFFRSQICSLETVEEEDWGSHKEYLRCRAGRSSFWISWDGTMGACGLMPFPKTFDAFDGNILEHWKELTEAVRAIPVMQACAGCKMRPICKPCVATIYAESGKTEGRAPYLCQLARCTVNRIKDYLKEHDDGVGTEE